VILTFLRCVGLSVGAVCLVSACGEQKVDHSPTGVVKQFVATSLLADTQKRHRGLYKLLGPRTQARLKASAAQATATTATTAATAATAASAGSETTGARRKYAPHEMLSASFRPGAKGNWTPKSFKLLGKTESTARVEVRGEKKGHKQVVNLVKVEGRWRIELDPAPAPQPQGTTPPPPKT
jgi:hypothetical protein